MENCKIEFKILGQKKVISNIIETINKNLKKIGHDIQDLYFRVEVAAKEMLTNAIEHGCQTKSDKITIGSEAGPSQVKIKVKDPDSGFDWTNKEFTIPLFKEEVRGLGMIDKVADKIEFNEKGNSITVYFIATD